MKSISETGHTKNAANFSKLIVFATAHGDRYQPASPYLQLPSLNELYSKALGRLDGVAIARNLFDQATANRMIAFGPLEKTATRAVNALEASGASGHTVKDARSLLNKIRPSGKKKPAGDETAGSHSTSQRSYDSLIGHFKVLINLLQAEPAYAPNEADLSISGLNQLLEQMENTNKVLNEQTVAYSNARIARDKILYLDENCLANIAQQVKKYIKSVFGADSPEYAQVKGIEIKK